MAGGRVQQVAPRWGSPDRREARGELGLGGGLSMALEPLQWEMEDEQGNGGPSPLGGLRG